MTFNLPRYKDYPAEIANKLRSQLKASSFIVKSYQVVVGGILPILEGVLVNLATGTNSDFPNPFLILLVVIALFHVALLTLLLVVETPLPQLLVEFDEQAEALAHKNLEANLHEVNSTTFIEALLAAAYSLLRIEQLKNLREDSLEKAFEKVLFPWIDRRTELFWFQEGRALYNFAVYVENERNVLDPKFRFCDSRMIRKNRSWRSGDGHVGACFLREETIFFLPEHITELPDSLKTTQPREEDAEYYASMMATPLMIDGEAKGVFIVTSSEPSQFIQELHAPIMDIIGVLLAQTMKYCCKE